MSYWLPRAAKLFKFFLNHSYHRESSRESCRLKQMNTQIIRNWLHSCFYCTWNICNRHLKKSIGVTQSWVVQLYNVVIIVLSKEEKINNNKKNIITCWTVAVWHMTIKYVLLKIQLRIMNRVVLYVLIAFAAPGIFLFRHNLNSPMLTSINLKRGW
jgi:hypothetical protein